MLRLSWRTRVFAWAPAHVSLAVRAANEKHGYKGLAISDVRRYLKRQIPQIAISNAAPKPPPRRM